MPWTQTLRVRRRRRPVAGCPSAWGKKSRPPPTMPRPSSYAPRGPYGVSPGGPQSSGDVHRLAAAGHRSVVGIGMGRAGKHRKCTNATRRVRAVNLPSGRTVGGCGRPCPTHIPWSPRESRARPCVARSARARPPPCPYRTSVTPAPRVAGDAGGTAWARRVAPTTSAVTPGAQTWRLPLRSRLATTRSLHGSLLLVNTSESLRSYIRSLGQRSMIIGTAHSAHQLIRNVYPAQPCICHAIAIVSRSNPFLISVSKSRCSR